MGKNTLNLVAMILLIVGGLNWLLVGLNSFGEVNYAWDLVARIFGSVPWLAAIIYILVGLAAVYKIVKFK